MLSRSSDVRDGCYECGGELDWQDDADTPTVVAYCHNPECGLRDQPQQTEYTGDPER